MEVAAEEETGEVAAVQPESGQLDPGQITWEAAREPNLLESDALIPLVSVHFEDKVHCEQEDDEDPVEIHVDEEQPLI